VLACTENHLRAAWRICLGLGAIPPISLFFLRLKISEPEPFTHEKMSVKSTPWSLCFRFYGFRLAIVSLIWFIYDFSAYSFGLYSTQILTTLNSKAGGDTKLWVSLGWSTLLNFFYMPGCLLGSFMADSFVGAKKTLIGALILQAIVGFAMAARYEWLAVPSRIGGFVVVYGLFLALGEVGPGDNIGLFASKTTSTSIRGKYYGLAAAVGKVGAYVGSWVFPEIGKLAGADKAKSGQYQFYVGASLSIIAAGLALFLPELDQHVVQNEDLRFREYLESHGYDTTQMGIKGVVLPASEAATHDVSLKNPDASAISKSPPP
jgi:MFS family permease